MFSCAFVYFNLINFLGSSLYISIIRNLVDTLACNYDVVTWTGILS